VYSVPIYLKTPAVAIEPWERLSADDSKCNEVSKKRDCHSGYNAQKVLLVLSGDEIKIPAKVSIAVLN